MTEHETRESHIPCKKCQTLGFFFFVSIGLVHWFKLRFQIRMRETRPTPAVATQIPRLKCLRACSFFRVDVQMPGTAIDRPKVNEILQLIARAAVIHESCDFGV